MIKHYRIHVIGTVQGVWFRKYTKETALRYELLGLVKNEQNGNVYIEAEGDEKDLGLFIEWLYTGSPLSIVKKVKWEEGSLRQFTQFDISR